MQNYTNMGCLCNFAKTDQTPDFGKNSLVFFIKAEASSGDLEAKMDSNEGFEGMDGFRGNR